MIGLIMLDNIQSRVSNFENIKLGDGTVISGDGTVFW